MKTTTTTDDWKDDFEFETFPKLPRHPERLKLGSVWEGLELISSGAAGGP